MVFHLQAITNIANAPYDIERCVEGRHADESPWFSQVILSLIVIGFLFSRCNPIEGLLEHFLLNWSLTLPRDLSTAPEHAARPRFISMCRSTTAFRNSTSTLFVHNRRTALSRLVYRREWARHDGPVRTHLHLFHNIEGNNTLSLCVTVRSAASLPSDMSHQVVQVHDKDISVESRSHDVLSSVIVITRTVMGIGSQF